MTDQDIHEVAFHEAGHAIIASQLGFRILRVSITKNDFMGRWDGATERPPGQYLIDGVENGRRYLDITGPLNEITITIAGFLAQARYVASTCSNSAQFSQDQDWSLLFNWMYDRHPEKQRPYPLRFTDAETFFQVIVDVQPRWFGGMDRSIYIREYGVIAGTPLGTNMNDYLTETIQYIMNEYNRACVWAKVACVANTLVDRCDGTSASLEAADFAEALNG